MTSHNSDFVLGALANRQLANIERRTDQINWMHLYANNLFNHCYIRQNIVFQVRELIISDPSIHVFSYIEEEALTTFIEEFGIGDVGIINKFFFYTLSEKSASYFILAGYVPFPMKEFMKDFPSVRAC